MGATCSRLKFKRKNSWSRQLHQTADFSVEFSTPSKWRQRAIQFQGASARHYNITYEPTVRDASGRLRRARLLIQLQNVFEAMDHEMTFEEYVQHCDKGFESLGDRPEYAFKVLSRLEGNFLSHTPSVFVEVQCRTGGDAHAHMTFQRQWYTLYWGGKFSLHITLTVVDDAATLDLFNPWVEKFLSSIKMNGEAPPPSPVFEDDEPVAEEQPTVAAATEAASTGADEAKSSASGSPRLGPEVAGKRTSPVEAGLAHTDADEAARTDEREAEATDSPVVSRGPLIVKVDKVEGSNMQMKRSESDLAFAS